MDENNNIVDTTFEEVESTDFSTGSDNYQMSLGGIVMLITILYAAFEGLKYGIVKAVGFFKDRKKRKEEKSKEEKTEEKKDDKVTVKKSDDSKK